ncbi:adenylate/guanylate cyclase domain-containing protein [Rhizobium beringeri]|nr:adenylate/guanylate cyclase domain-containing protein [Rhizobium beringeri]
MVERHLTVILAADVVGYSHLMEADEERTHAAFRTCHAVIAELISRHRGRIFSGAGDSVLAEFASPVEAMRAAVNIQADLAERSLDLPENHQMKFRIGLNLGDVIDDDGISSGTGSTSRHVWRAWPNPVEYAYPTAFTSMSSESCLCNTWILDPSG